MLNVLETEPLRIALSNPLAPCRLTTEIVDNQINPALRSNISVASRHLASTFGRNGDTRTDRSSNKLSTRSMSDSEDGSELASGDDEDEDQVEGWGATNRRESTHPGKSVQILWILTHRPAGFAHESLQHSPVWHALLAPEFEFDFLCDEGDVVALQALHTQVSIPTSHDSR